MPDGFTLVEVVMALGIVVFAGLALLGLFSIGLATNRESIEELEATHVAQTILSLRRASPLAADPAVFSLPPLNEASAVSSAEPRFVDEEGRLVAGAKGAKFGLVYRITPAADGAGASDVYLCLYWPAGGPAQKALGCYESYTKLPLP